MFAHLLVPLDGSRMSEASLPMAAYLGHKLQCPVTLLHVIERNAPVKVHGERHLADAAEAEAYLKQVAATRFPADLRTELHVHTAEVKDVARSIADHGNERQPALIVMCTHGRGAVREWIFGSIAQQVAAAGRTPILFVRPGAEAVVGEFTLACLALPLDGNRMHENALPIAVGLARACQASVHLISVVPTPATLAGPTAAAGRLLPAATRALLDADQEQAAAYLESVRAGLTVEGVEASAERLRGEPAAMILQAAERAQADVIIFGTHGTIGTEAFWARSVPPNVAGHTLIPILLVPVREDPAGVQTTPLRN